ncbi:MAG TPA: CsgG/HfaB family protein [Thermoanaerobaculia bacterium]|nr:CsgG/HfaB family protein [Thermoanaerobaculia bacterium]
MKVFAQAFTRIMGAALLLAAAAVAQAQEAGGEAGARYTAQRRPRVTVFEFEDTNRNASKAGYASSVEAMLVTFLQSRSQFVVVERQKLGELYEEKRRIQTGMVDVPPGDTTSRELLEKIDAYILGSVTLLEGSRIEIDAKLISLFTGRVVATAQRSGPVTCLRSVVERLGAAIEQEFLRPHYGRVEVRLKSPENVSIFLMPISRDTASGEERAPAERSSSVIPGGEFDTIQFWRTAPTSATIDNILPGWYSLRLARPGYEDLKTDPTRFEVHLRFGRPEVYDRTVGLPLSLTSPELQRFVVRVDSGSPEAVDLDALGFVMRKKGGSLAPRVKLHYLDKDFTRVPGRAILMGGRGLDLNRFGTPGEPRGDSKCDLLREPLPVFPDYGLTRIAPGQTFDFGAFQGGELVLEDYQGELVPAGQYQLALWAPGYPAEKIEVTVSDGELGKAAQAALGRDTSTLEIEATGPRPGSRVILEGRETRLRRELPLDFASVKEERGLPADTYKVWTNVSGLEGWKQTVIVRPSSVVPPRYYTQSPPYDPKVTRTSEEARKPERPRLIVKTRLALAGRLEILSRLPEPPGADLFLDGEVGTILDLLFHEQRPRPENPEELRRLLIRRLEVVDLLLLDPRDMARLLRSSEDAAIVRGYVKKGGALFAFITEPGDYGDVVGAPLAIEPSGRPTNRFTLSLGEVSGILPWLEKKADAPSKRVLPELVRFHPGLWKVIAFTQGRRSPRIVERGQKDDGGYIVLWLDDPGSFRDAKGKTVSQVEETRAWAEERVIKWAKYLMYRRYDKSGKLRRRAEEELGIVGPQK